MARRVNKKFLIILTCVIVGGGVALLVAGKLLFRHSPEEFIATGDSFMAQGQQEKAIQNYLQARALKPGDPSILVRIGDAFEARSVTEPAFAGKERAAWHQALEVQSDYVPALERLFAVYRDDAEAVPGPDTFDRVRDIARRLMAAKPDDLEVRSYVHSIPIRRILAGIVVPDVELDQAVAALRELHQRDPSLADPPFWIAQSRILRAIDRRRSGYVQEAQALLNEAAALFDNTKTDQAQNAAMHLRAFQTFSGLSRLEADTAKQKALADRAQSEIELARKVAKDDDPRFIEIHLAAAQQALASGDRPGAEKLLRDLLVLRPNDQPVRLMLAKLLGTDADTRAEAIELLSRPVAPSDRAYKTRTLELTTLLEQTNLRLDAYAATHDAAGRQAAAKIIETNLQRIDTWLGGAPEALRLRGRYALLRDDTTQAIQLLSRAVNLLAQNNRPKDYDLMFQLARAYRAGNQTGQAKSLLIEIVERFPTFPGARLLLAELLLRENSVAEAQRQLQELEKLAPDAPEVHRLRLAVLKAAHQDDKAKQLYAQMPESTDAERRAKAEVALAMGESAEALRLLEQLHAAAPGDASVLGRLVQVYVQLNRKDQAIAAVAKALEAKPDDPQLLLLQKSLAGATPEELIAQIPDEFTRELRLFELAVSRNNAEAALTHLKRAEQLKPDDNRVMDLLFQQYLQARDWGSATAYMDRLAKADADHAGGAIYKFRLAMAQGKVDQATQIARELTGTMGEFAQSWLMLGQALQAGGRYEEAVSRYAMAIEKQSENLDAYRGIIQCYYALNQPNDARRYIEQGRRIFPSDPTIREMQVQYALNYGNPDEAVADREAALKTDPQSPQNWLNVGIAYLRAAQVRADRNEIDAARQWLDKARKLFTDAMAKWPDEARFYGYRAEVALAGQQFQEGLDALNALAARDGWKDRAEPQVMLGEYYARSGKIDEAEKAYRLALERGGNAVEVQLKLVSLLAQTGKVDDALKLLELNAQDPRVLAERIRVLMGSQRFAEAEKVINAGLEKDPEDPELIKSLAALYISTDRKALAQDRLKQVLAKNSNDAEALRYMGLIHVLNNEPDEAIKALLVARERRPDDVDVRYFLARAYQLKNDLDGAARELDAALKIQPLNKQLRLELVNVNSSLQRWGEVERLIREARAMSAYAKDPDWAQAEALMWTARGDGTKAITAIREAIELNPNDVRLVQNYFDILLRARAYQQVLDETGKILAAGQQPWWIYQVRGIAYRRLDKKDEALAEFDKALKTTDATQSPDISTRIAQTIAREIGVDETLSRLQDRIEKENRWRIFAVYLYQSRNDTANAIRLLDRVLAEYDKLSGPEQDSALRLAGLVYIASPAADGVQKAYDAYLKLLKKYPNDLAALNNLACLLADKMNRPQQALVYSEQAYRLMQQVGQLQPLVLDTHGWCLVQSGRVEEGIALLRQALERQSFPDAYYHLGVGYLKQQNPQEARKHLTVAQDMIQQAEKNNQPVDPGFKRQVSDALAQADQMLKAKGQATVN